MTTGMEIRARIDADIIKALILINGGAAVALLALLPYVLGRGDLHSFAVAILRALLMFMFALLSAVVSSVFRRKCSLEWEIAKATSSDKLPSPCTIFEKEFFKEPCVCIWGTAFMCLSVFLFVLAGITVFRGGISAISVSRPWF